MEPPKGGVDESASLQQGSPVWSTTVLQQDTFFKHQVGSNPLVTFFPQQVGWSMWHVPELPDCYSKFGCLGGTE